MSTRRHEQAVIIAARAGDPDAIAQLVREAWPQAWRAALAVSGSREGAEDIVQDALAHAFQDLERFEDAVHLSRWLRQAAVRRAIDTRRSDRARAERERVVAIDRSGHVHDPDEGLDWDSCDPELLTACRALPPDMRHVLLLRFWADMELHDIAAALGVPLGTVKSRLARTLSHLREELQEKTESIDDHD